MTYYIYSELQKGILITAGVAMCGFQIMLLGAATYISIQALLRNPSGLLDIAFWIIVVGGGYGLTCLGLIMFRIEWYAAFGIPLSIRVGLIAGAALSIYMLIDTGLKNQTAFMALFFPLGPLAFLTLCLFLISRLRRRECIANPNGESQIENGEE